MVAVYRQYLGTCRDTQKEYLAAEAQAKAQGLGFWHQNSPVMPWDYRRGKRSERGLASTPNSAATSPEDHTTSAISVSASRKEDYNCSDFSTQVEAQKVLDASPGDPYKLDSNKDGEACESLP